MYNCIAEYLFRLNTSLDFKVLSSAQMYNRIAQYLSDLNNPFRHTIVNVI